MYTVLLPVDTDLSRATSQAEMVANLPRAGREVQAVLLHVFDDPRRAEDTLPTRFPAGEAAMQRLQQAGVTVELRSESGRPPDVIVRVADAIDADLTVLGGRKRSPLGSALFGSVSQQVTLEAERPVVVTGDEISRTRPSHRCRSCGETYYSERGPNVEHCRRCGGTEVQPIDEERVQAS